jgi:hypothetical protein
LASSAFWSTSIMLALPSRLSERWDVFIIRLPLDN